MTSSKSPELTDALLERMLGERAGSVAPVDFVPGVVLAIDAAPQVRRGWLGLRWPDQRAARVLVLVSIAALLALTLGAVLVGASLLRESPLSDIRPAPTSPLSAEMQSSPSPRPSDVASSPAVDFESLPYDVESCCQLRFFDDSTGWYGARWHVGTPASLYLWRTTDAGRSWVRIVGPRGLEPAAVTLVDAETVALTYLGPEGVRHANNGEYPGPVTIAVSHDAGASWNEVTLPEGSTMTIPGVEFSTPEHGSAIFLESVSRSGEGVHTLYQTIDGGQTWTRSSRSAELIPPNDPGAINGIGTASGTMLRYVGPPCDRCSVDNRLWLSRNGGQTWLEGSFPVDRDLPRKAIKGIDGFLQEPDSSLLLLVSSDRGRAGFYTSHDDARSWQRIAGPPPCDGATRLLSATEWVTFRSDDYSACSTTDGGAHWQINHPEPPIAGSASEYMEFVSATHAWALNACRPPDARYRPSATYPPSGPCVGTGQTHLLYETIDGGRTWRSIGGTGLPPQQPTLPGPPTPTPLPASTPAP